MTKEARLEADAWYRALKSWRIEQEWVEIAKYKSNPPPIRLVAGQYAQLTNAERRPLTPIVHLPSGSYPAPLVDSIIRQAPWEYRTLLRAIRHGDKKLDSLLRKGYEWRDSTAKGIALACLWLKEQLNG